MFKHMKLATYFQWLDGVVAEESFAFRYFESFQEFCVAGGRRQEIRDIQQS